MAVQLGESETALKHAYAVEARPVDLSSPDILAIGRSSKIMPGSIFPARKLLSCWTEVLACRKTSVGGGSSMAHIHTAKELSWPPWGQQV